MKSFSDHLVEMVEVNEQSDQMVIANLKKVIKAKDVVIEIERGNSASGVKTPYAITLYSKSVDMYAAYFVHASKITAELL